MGGKGCQSDTRLDEKVTLIPNWWILSCNAKGVNIHQKRQKRQAHFGRYVDFLYLYGHPEQISTKDQGVFAVKKLRGFLYTYEVS